MNTSNLRTTGAHIHFSWDGINQEQIEETVKACDLFLGVPSVIIEPENTRRELYGKAGEFRFSGDWERAEYRSLSSYFAGTEDLCRWTYNNTHKAIEWVEDENKIDISGNLAKEIIETINTSNKEKAFSLIKEYNIPVPVLQ